MGRTTLPRPGTTKNREERGSMGSWADASPTRNSSSTMALSECNGAYEVGRQSDCGPTPSDINKIEECLEIDPEDLLDENRDLLQLDFERLATGPVKDKMEWIAEMESAMGAAEHVSYGSRHTVRTRYCTGRRPRARIEYKAVLVDQEGSMK